MASHQGMLMVVLAVVLLALPSLTYGETLHVRPTSTNTSCPTHPCHTLSEYAQDIEQYFNDSNLTLLFLPGNHTLNVNLTIVSIHQLEILGAMVSTRVVCNSNVGFTFMDIPEVKIVGLALVACARSDIAQVGNSYFTTYYGLHLQSVQMADIIDCTFQDSYGSALGVVDSHVVLRGNNNFLSNCRMCSNGGCYWGPYHCFGGGVFATKSNLSFTGSSSFISNSAYKGGGVYAQSNSNVNISEKTIFNGNSACDSGGGFYAGSNTSMNIGGNATFIGNSAWYIGGAIYAGYSSDVNIGGNTTFSSNSVSRNLDTICHGGGIYINSNSTAKINGNTTFIDNFASGDGGGVYAKSNTVVKISGNTTFIGNSARRAFSREDLGGGVYAGSNSIVTISGNTTLIGNFARFGGGGVSVGSNSSMDISGNTTFIDNSAKYGGGVFSQSNSSIIIRWNTTFINNSASHDGGGVYVRSSNVNPDPASVYYSGGYRVTVRLDTGSSASGEGVNLNITGNTTFVSNSASRHGGGAYLDSYSNMTVNGNTTFITNSATRHGGGVYAESNNNITISGNANFIGNIASGNVEEFI